jgi:hypothetical protein
VHGLARSLYAAPGTVPTPTLPDFFGQRLEADDEPSTDGGADANATDALGRTPLFVAACQGHTQTVLSLVLDFDADVDTADENGRTPVFAAAANGHTQTVLALLLEYMLIKWLILNWNQINPNQLLPQFLLLVTRLQIRKASMAILRQIQITALKKIIPNLLLIHFKLPLPH